MGKVEKLTAKIDKIDEQIKEYEEMIEIADIRCEAGEITKAQREKLKMKYKEKLAGLRVKKKRLVKIRINAQRKLKEKELKLMEELKEAE